MPRELETYRPQLQRMDELFPETEMLSVADVMKLTGTCYNTTKRYFPFKGHYISKINVAHRLAELGRMT